jgi:hypothetical protein
MPKYDSKPGKHGTLYRWEIEYKSTDSGSPVFTTHTWAYNLEHAVERFFDGADEDWKIVRLARVQPDVPHHRWSWHK